jgi:hypothetical protein
MIRFIARPYGVEVIRELNPWQDESLVTIPWEEIERLLRERPTK